MEHRHAMPPIENLPEIERVEVDPGKLGDFRREEDFTDLAVRLVVETASYVCVAACSTDQTGSWDRAQATVGGNMVRLYKLLHALLDQTCQRRGEIAFIILRLVFETIVNIRYLIAENSPELVNSYIGHSLRHERKLHDQILINIENRRGIVLPIEDRMLKSIERAALAANIPIESVDLSDKSPWGRKNTFDKARSVGLEPAYLSLFGGGSHSVHGSWQELYGNHLNWESPDRFTARTEWNEPRPQALFALSILVADTLNGYFDFIGNSEVPKVLSEPIAELRERILSASRGHENYLAPKQWPEI